MKVLKALKSEQVNNSTQAIFNNIKKKVGSITNYIFSNGDFEIDFPKAANLKEVAVA